MSSEIDINVNVNAADAPSQLQAVADAEQQVGTSSDTMGAATSRNWGGFEATMGRTSVMGIVMMDRLSIAQQAVENAQIRAQLAQQRYTDAVTKYGPASEQAKRAQQELQIATDGVGIATQREEIRFLIMAGITIPQMIRGVYSMIGTLGGYTTATGVATIGTITLTNAMRALLAASIIGIPMVIATAALFSGGLGGGSGGNVNVYGDVNMTGSATPTGFGTSTTAWAQTVR